MQKNIKTYLDYIPLVILLLSAIPLVWIAATTTRPLLWKHYLGLILLAISLGLFFIRHLYGVFAVGLILLLGLFSLLSFSISTRSLSFIVGKISTVPIQPVFLLWVVIYIVISGRHFVGIAARRYWIEVKNKQR